MARARSAITDQCAAATDALDSAALLCCRIEHRVRNAVRSAGRSSAGCSSWSCAISVSDRKHIRRSKASDRLSSTSHVVAAHHRNVRHHTLKAHGISHNHSAVHANAKQHTDASTVAVCKIKTRFH